MIWAYYICLSSHMWDDGGGAQRYPYLPAASMGCFYGYTEDNYIDMATWDEMMKFLKDKRFNTVVIDLGDGVKWESHPEIAAPNAWGKEVMKQKLDEIRALGITPIPSLNFSACHHAWLKEYRRMVGTSVYRRVCDDLITEACELFDKPELFWLSLDEESSASCHEFREAKVIRHTRLLWEDYHFFMDVCRRNGVRPWMSADYFWDRNELFLKNVPKDVLISNWYYCHFQNYKEDTWIKRSQDAYEKLEKFGYDQLPLCSTCGAVNTSAYETMLHCKKYISEEHLKGYMTAAWVYTMPDELWTLQNDAHRFYQGRRLVYPESL